MVTDEEVIVAFLTHKGYSEAARSLKLGRRFVEGRLKRMVLSGVVLPPAQKKSGVRKYPPKRVAELNEFIKNHEQKS